MKMLPLLHGRAIAWAAMTPDQQAEHLVHGHGFNHDYFAGHEGVLAALADEDLVGHFAGAWDARQRAHWHDGDHFEDGPDFPPRFVHTHDKVVPA